VFDRRRQSDPAFHEDEWAVARNGGRAVRRGRWASAGPAAGTRRRHGEECRSLRRRGGRVAVGRREASRRRACVRDEAPSVERRAIAARTPGEVDPRKALEQRRPRCRSGGGSGLGSIGEQASGDRQRGRYLAWGEQAAVADLHETRWEDVQEEPAEEF